VHVHPQLEAGISNLILKSEAHELSLMMAQGKCKLRGPFETDGATSMLDIAEMGARDTQALGKLSEALSVTFTNRR
jgi:hypothetical protein